MITFGSIKQASAPSREELLWENYRSRGELVINELIEFYVPLTHRVLERVSMRLPSHIPVEDLSQAALLGLYKAIQNFSAERGVPFEAYAYPRIRGAVIDELRSGDFLSRNKRNQVDRVEQVIAEWMRDHNEMPSEEQIAGEMNMSVDEFNRLMDQARPWCSLDASAGDERSLQETLADPHADAEALVRRHDMQQLLQIGFNRLDSREQKILYLYYYEELRLSEIAELFGLTEARISQLHALSMVRLRASLAEDYPSEFAA